MKIEFTDDEILYLHDIIVYKIDTGDMPECTWEENCFSCNLYKKFYQAFVDVRDKSGPTDN